MPGTQTANQPSKSKSISAARKRPGPADDAIAMLKADHRKVEKMFKRYENLKSAKEKTALAREICKELIIHTMLEEEIFYSACREMGVKPDLMDEAQVEHDGAKVMIGELMADDASASYYDAKVTVLSEYIKHHVKEEEQPAEGVFAKARKAGVDTQVTGEQMVARKEELLRQAQTGALGEPEYKALSAL